MNMMSNILSFPVQPVAEARLRRPSTLVRAAVAGQSHWRRERDLRRVLQSDNLPAPGCALPHLRAEEDRMNVARQEGAADYDMHHHVLLMIAILAEMRCTVPPAELAGGRGVGRQGLALRSAEKTVCAWRGNDHFPRKSEPSTPRTIT